NIHIDYEQGTYLATEALIKKGHELIGYISHSLDSQEDKEKLQGYKKALYDNNMSFNNNLVFVGIVNNNPMHVGYEGASFLVPMGVTAIMTSDDVIASGVYQAANEMRVNIPSELSVIGFGNLALSEH